MDICCFEFFVQFPGELNKKVVKRFKVRLEVRLKDLYFVILILKPIFQK